MDELVFTGIQPVKKGGTGDKRWFVIDDSGTFSINRSITADIWLVGGGCDGDDGEWITTTYTALGATGGAGGYVSLYKDIELNANESFDSVIALANDKSGTQLIVSGSTYMCDNSGCTATVGGKGSSITGDGTGQHYTINYKPENGETGASTPYGAVGSSGGGGMACDGHDHRTGNGKGGTGAGNGGTHRQEGSDATNYGCGGGGGDGCGAVAKGNVGGKGMQGCIIVQYTIEDDYIDPVVNPSPPPQEPPIPPEEYVPPVEEKKKYIIIRNFRRVTTVKQKEINNATVSSSSCCCCTTNGGDCDCNKSTDGSSNANYTDSVNIKGMSADELSAQIQSMETENLIMLKRIQELRNERGIL